MTRPRMPYNPALGSTAPGAKEFQQARRRADAELRRSRRTGQSADLLCFDQVRDMLQAHAVAGKVLRTIPLDAIIGSVGRCSDYTRSFRPLKDSARQRWIGIQDALTESKPLPPIQVVQLGEAYFVSDGHHRVSVAREQGITSIEAVVTLVESPIPLSADTQPDELALQAQYARFLASTRLDEIRPDADLRVTVLDEYEVLQEEIEGLYLSIRDQWNPDATLTDAASLWYDEVYLPAVLVVRSHRLAQQFEGRTETDLVLWLREYRQSLEEALGWDIDLDMAAAGLARQHRTAQRTLPDAAGSVTNLLRLHGLQVGPKPGTWRNARELGSHENCFFDRILVPFTGEDDDWPAIAQAAAIACRESAQLLGVHIVPPQTHQDPDQIEAVRDKFLRHCRVNGARGSIAIDEGDIASSIFERSQWADLVVLRPQHAPPEGLTAKLGCGLHTLLRRCTTPLLIVPGEFSALERPLLSYDGSAKAREALFVAADLASLGQLSLIVVTVAEEGRLDPSPLLAEAGRYLESRGIKATLVEQEGSVAEALMHVADEYDNDLILMGGYGHSPLVELLSGSVVDDVLHASKQPVLLCH